MAFKIFSSCSELDIGCYVYTDAELTTLLTSTIISDRYHSYDVDGSGIITSKDICQHS